MPEHGHKKVNGSLKGYGMKRNVDINEISDGRFYSCNDMVKADTGDCAGCSACCHGMGNSIILDPYDGYRLCGELKTGFEELLQGSLELNVVDGIILPNLKMQGADEACSFLDEQGRCRIHGARPGVCRLFPLGRFYEGRDFRYFLQVHECKKASRAKVKVKKWLDTPELAKYEEYIRTWHYFLEDVQHILDGSENDNLRKQVNMYLLQEFFVKAWTSESFYPQFEERLSEAKRFVGLA